MAIMAILANTTFINDDINTAHLSIFITAVREDRMPGGRNSGAVYNMYKVRNAIFMFRTSIITITGLDKKSFVLI